MFQCIILSPSNEPPALESVLRFLSEHNDESERDIVQRFEKGVSTQGYMHDEWQKFRASSLMSINPAPVTVDIPRLENLMNSDSSRDSISNKHQKSTKNMQNSNLFPVLKSTCSTMSSTSNDSSLSSGGSLLLAVQNNESSREKPILSERKSSAISSRNVTERSSQYMKSNRDANVNDEILVEIRKTADDSLPVVLEKEFIPSVPSLEEATVYPLTNVKKNIPASLCSSLRSDDDKVTVRYMPAKISTTDVAVSTDPVFMDHQLVEKIEVGVNTIAEMASNTADGSSSSNTASDNSAGQLPKRLFDTVLQRPSLRIVSLRPDGSIVPTGNSSLRCSPSVREWTPVTSGGNSEKSLIALGEIREMASESNLNHSEYNGMRKSDSVAASASGLDPFEEDLNTLANISPLPHS
ncbi:unnamed protein product [Acanthocheilonema viteae]|uniref:Uncharacterized protein n=1 Tax=Acanthocheilonema viteae TaxID=6277 RepID=A0A498S9H1_ACAVI|nr:unnamed protein product [Acanthocheilonema viteae]